jgi:hypothetical protein
MADLNLKHFGPAFHFNANLDPDPAFHINADLDRIRVLLLIKVEGRERSKRRPGGEGVYCVVQWWQIRITAPC